MAEREQRPRERGRGMKRVGKPHEQQKQAEKSEHQLGPLTINTHLLDNFGLGPNYTDLQPIGFGANGLVVSAIDIRRNLKVAAKKIKVESQISCRYALREIRIMCKMQHENIVNILDVLRENGASLNTRSKEENTVAPGFSQVFLVQELLDTNLHVLITQKVLEQDHVCLLFYQVLRGLHYLKSANIIHRDLKPSNLLINCDTLLLKIGDFGLARIVDPNYNHAGHLTAGLGTYWYRAPELLLNPQFYSAAIDMWSAGCILGEMLLGKPLFTGATELDQLRVILDSVELTERDWSAVLHVLPNKMLHHHPMSPQCPLAHRLDDAGPTVIDMLENLLMFDPNQRLTPEAGLAHQYLHSYASPGREPIASNPFAIESEVDNIPSPLLKKIIIRDSNKNAPGCGHRIPTPSHLHRPKVSSATLSLAPSTSKPPSSQTCYLTVPTSPTYDNLIQEQRRNRRNKMSASLDLSFIELPGPELNQGQKRSDSFSDEMQKKCCTRSTGEKNTAPPSPWKWPEVGKDVPLVGEQLSNNETLRKVPGEDLAGEMIIKPQPRDEIVFNYSSPWENLQQPARPVPAHIGPEHIDPSLSALDKANPPSIIISRHSPGKESHFIASHVPRVSPPRVAERATECMVSDHAAIEQIENQKNRTVGMNLGAPQQQGNVQAPSRVVSSATLKCVPASTSRGRMSESPEPSRLRVVTESSRSSSRDRTQVVSLPPSGARSSVGSKGAPPSAGPSGVREETVLPPGTGDSADKSQESKAPPGVAPSNERKVSVATIECEPLKPIPCPDYVQERKVSAATIECSPGTSLSVDTKVSSAVMGRVLPDSMPGRHQMPGWRGKEHTERGDFENIFTPGYMKESKIGDDNAKSSLISAALLEKQLSCGSSESIQSLGSPPVYLASLSSPEALCEGCGEKLHCLTRGCAGLAPLTVTNVPPVQQVCRGTQQTRGARRKRALDSSPPVLDRTMSGEKERSPERTPDMSPLMLDLTFTANKELQKYQEEEKDKAEVSPRKLQEDWEIESQSSSQLETKSEWTLSEILGDCEEEMGVSACSGDSQRIEDLEPFTGDRKTREETDISVKSQTGDKCRAELEMIPWHIIPPEPAHQQCALSVIASSPQIRRKCNQSSDRSSSEKVKETSSGEKETKCDRKFTTELFWESKQGDHDEAAGANTVDVSSDASIIKGGVGVGKEGSHEDLPPTSLLKFSCETPEQPHVLMTALSKFAHHKSEEDLSSACSQSPWGVSEGHTTKAALPRESEKSAFEQCLRENLSSLKVSIPKDLPEKRHLVKARSTEDVSFEGEVSRSLQTANQDSTEDLIQFSPVGGAKSDDAAEGLDHVAGAQCNHCIDQGKCKEILQCQSSRSGTDWPKKNQSDLARLVAEKASSGSDGCSSDEDKKMPFSARADRSLELPDPPRELCLSKDVFNERQKLMSWDSGSQGDRSESLPKMTKSKIRPRSAKK